jgi:lactate dehydrogenase-like 2-hydroxyacid dehydrogenase
MPDPIEQVADTSAGAPMTGSTRVLRAGWLKPSLVADLDRRYGALPLPEDDTWADFARRHGEQVEAVVCSGRAGVTMEQMRALPRLRAVINHGVGFDRVDVGFARRTGIQVANTPDVLTDCVADTAVGLVLDVMRGLSAADRFVRAGRWPAERNFPLMRRVTGRKVGILGLGRIGLAVARRLDGFGAAVSYHGRRQRDDVAYAYAPTPVDLARDSDVLVVTAAGGPQTERLVGRAVLEALGPRGFLVNVARGSVVDEDVLVSMLVSGDLGGAGLDVFSHEPEVPARLLELDNVVLLPHLASGTEETREAIAQLVLQNLDSYFSTGTVLTPV